MSVLTVDHGDPYRTFAEGEALPDIWEEAGVPLPSDEAVVIAGDEGRVIPIHNLPQLPKVVEGTGFLVLRAS